jgi:(S)-ureidoglycine aminohydrolase
MGARFQQYIAHMEPGSHSAGAMPGVERFIFVLSGSVRLSAEKENVLTEGYFANIPADAAHSITTIDPGKILVFEKRYAPLAGAAAAKLIVAHERECTATAFLGDPDAMLKVLLPEEASYDWAINIFSFIPGATLPFVEVHVMEHGLMLLEGQGVYRLDDNWYPIQAGDVIWMAPYCPQWWVAAGKTPSRYIYYKDMARDALM